MIIRPVYAVIEREILRTLRQRTRLLASLIRPLIWLFVIGAGFGAALSAGGIDYQRYLVPGVLGMTLLFGAMLAALSLVYDRESGVMRMLIVAPLAHYWIVIAKLLSATLAALLQALLLLVVLAVLGFIEPQTHWLLLAVALIASALTCAGIGVLTAAFSRTLENFAAVMNFVIFPVFFLSGALYAVDTLPAPFKLLALLNPFSYAVDLLKHALPVSPGALTTAEFGVARDLLYALGFTVFALVVASWRFSRQGRYEPLIHRLAGKRGRA
jgi:ABC-2 type transport system permease protein